MIPVAVFRSLQVACQVDLRMHVVQMSIHQGVLADDETEVRWHVVGRLATAMASAVLVQVV